MKSTKPLAATLSVFALLFVAAPAVAQPSDLALTFSPSIGLPEVWALMAPGQKAMMTVSQERLGTTSDAKIIVLFSPVQALGELDLEHLGILYQTSVQDGADLQVNFQVPQAMDGLIFSVQAVALYPDGQIALSSVVTVFFDSAQTGPSHDGSNNPKSGSSAPADTQVASEADPAPVK